MEPQVLLDSAAALIGLFLLAVILYGPWQSLMTDRIRQSIFDARAELFDIAASGRLPFEDQTYREIRLSMDRMIRFAHEMTWSRFLLYQLILPLPEGPGRFNVAIAAIEDEELQKEVVALRRKIANELAISMVLRSPVLMFGVLPIVLIFLMIAKIVRPTRVAEWWREKKWGLFQTLQREVDVYEDVEQSATQAVA